MSASAKDKAAHWVRPEIRALKAYAVPDATGLIKLDAMENPYAFPEDMRRDWLRVLQQVDLNRYPDPAARRLKDALRTALDIPPSMSILLGNGSDELIQLIALALAQPGRVVLAPVPTFVMYDMIATFTGMRFVGVPLTPDFDLDLPAMLAAIHEHRPAVIFLAYPNNPTGNLFDADAMQQILSASDGLVVVDEAYHAFAGVSFMQQLGRYDNLVIMRTLSKQGLAGLRLGVLAGDAAWLDEFDKLRLPYNINSLTQASAEFALTQGAVLQAQAQRIGSERERVFQALAALAGVRVWPSRANFILLRIESGDASRVHQGMRERGILIKNLDPAGAALKGCLRITLGTPEENAAMLAALAQALGQGVAPAQ
jgi:histidinol-phosphate aminotransferase